MFGREVVSTVSAQPLHIEEAHSAPIISYKINSTAS